MNTADTIREAARLIRERAEAASPGPYFTTGKSARYGGLVATPSDGHPEDQGYDGHLIGESMSEANLAHLGGWPPAVALAVAAWLETEARMAEKRDNSPEGHTFHALNVARAYLARTGDHHIAA
ncbi:hypothetical protein [Micromonospora sp. DT229]|uniref:hypothetical protein n=1 Tax=Micromonospora sp. DT229 TaxID=3393430 RepID=UPI003CE68339